MKILVIDLDNIGDVVMASFIPRALKKIYSDSYLGFLVKEYSKDVIINNPFIDEIIIFNPSWLGDLLNKRFNWIDTWKLIKKIKSAKYDLAIVVNSDWKKALIPFLAHIPRRVGQDKKKARYLLTEAVAFKDDPLKHMVEYNLELVRALGAEIEKVMPEVFIAKNTERWLDSFLISQDITREDTVIGIHPGAGDPAKTWSEENFIALINKLLNKEKTKILVIESKGDNHAVNIVSKINNNRVIAARNISIIQMAAVFKRCEFVIANDTGPMHLACAVGTKVIAIFGPSNPKRYGPYGEGHIIVRKELDCSPCSRESDCKTLFCIKNISVEDIMQAIKSLGVF